MLVSTRMYEYILEANIVKSDRSVQCLSHCKIFRFILHWVDKCLSYSVIDQDIVFLVSDSRRATVCNGNSIRADFTENTITND